MLKLIQEKGMSAPLAALLFSLLAALAGCWDGLTFITSADVPRDAMGEANGDAPSLGDVAMADGGDATDVAPPDIVAADVTDVTTTDSGDAGDVDAATAPDTVVADATDAADVPLPPDVRDAATDAVDTTPTPDAPPPPDTSCPTGQTRCGGVCVNTATDPSNCGRCGGTCDARGTCREAVCELVVSVARGGHVAVGDRAEAPDFWTARMARAGSVVNGNVTAATYVTRDGAGASVFGIDRSWVEVPTPTGRLVSVSVRLYPPYRNSGDRNPGMAVYGVAFTPDAPSPRATDYSLSHWGSENFIVDPPLCRLFSLGEEVVRPLTPAGVAYLQMSAGRVGLFGLRTSFDVMGTPPTGNYSGVELGDSPPHAEFTFRYTPP